MTILAMSEVQLFAAVSAALAVALGLALGLLLRHDLRAGRPLGSALLRAGLVGAPLACLVAVGAHLNGAGFFGAIHWLYLAVVVALPIVGVLLVLPLRGRRGQEAGPAPRPRGRVVLGAVLMVPALLGWWATHVEPGRLRVDRAELALPSARTGSEPLRIDVLSDLQTTHAGSHETEVVDRLVAERLDVILVPGDVLQAPAEDGLRAVPGLRALFARLAASAPVLVVRGHVDSDEELQAITEGTGARLVTDDVIELDVGDRRLVVGGVSVEHESARGRATIAELAAAGAADPRVTTILVSHVPDVAMSLPSGSPIDLVVAGHTHGGQVSLPFVGPLLTASHVPQEVAAGGLHELGGVPLYVSGGAGLERGFAPQVRFGVRPSVGVVTLTG
jgi:predicted MPP superfamily phosphohydrolase